LVLLIVLRNFSGTFCRVESVMNLNSILSLIKDVYSDILKWFRV
jgi:hypothetical protein